ncbi:MAG: T9SS type A sorting domain-containing protein, partial [Bacteroidia bacterium]
WGTGLPKTSVTDLEIYYPTQKLRAGTYGRGIWETDLATPLGVSQTQTQQTEFTLFPNPANSEVTLNTTAAPGTLLNIEITNLQGEIVYTSREPATQRTINVSGFAKGVYFVSITENGSRSVKKLTVY